jgi:hypothetical protein
VVIYEMRRRVLLQVVPSPPSQSSRLMYKQVHVTQESECSWDDTARYSITAIDILATSLTYSQSLVQMQINKRSSDASQQL